MKPLAKLLALTCILATCAFATSAHARQAAAATTAATAKPTIVLVHGAFADSSSWNGVAARLLAQGYPVVAVANPLRSVKGDAAAVDDALASIDGPVVLVGHSYGGSVISNAGDAGRKVKALVFVSAFAPEAGESAAALSARFPGSTLGDALSPPVALRAGGNDLYIRQDRFHQQFAADIPAADAAIAAVAQRPITEAALNEASGTPLWASVPSWWIYGSADRNIPPAAMAFMARRAHARHVVEIDGASHVVMLSHPDEVARLVVEAAGAR